MQFSFLDILIVIPFIWAIYKGITKGFIRQLASLGALILGVWAAAKFSGWLGEYLHTKFDVALKLAQITSFVIIFIAVIIGMMILSRLLESAVQAASLGVMDKILGVLFAIIKTAIIVGVILSFFDLANNKLDMIGERDIKKSLLYKPLVTVTPIIFPALKFEMKEVMPKEKENTEENIQ